MALETGQALQRRVALANLGKFEEYTPKDEP